MKDVIQSHSADFKARMSSMSERYDKISERIASDTKKNKESQLVLKYFDSAASQDVNAVYRSVGRSFLKSNVKKARQDLEKQSSDLQTELTKLFALQAQIQIQLKEFVKEVNKSS